MYHQENFSFDERFDQHIVIIVFIELRVDCFHNLQKTQSEACSA